MPFVPHADHLPFFEDVAIAQSLWLEIGILQITMEGNKLSIPAKTAIVVRLVLKNDVRDLLVPVELIGQVMIVGVLKVAPILFAILITGVPGLHDCS